MLSKTPRGWLEGCYIKADASNLVDLTHQWYEGMTQAVFFSPMVHELRRSHEKHGALSYVNHLVEECGTHCEAAAHMRPDGPTIEQTPISWLIGPAVVVDIRKKCQENPDYKLNLDDLKTWENKHGRIPDNSWLIMNSGWTERWDLPTFFNRDKEGKEHYPGFDPLAMRWLVETNRHIVGIAPNV